MEVTIAKVKLTKSMCNQLLRADTDTMAYGKVLGFVVGVMKDACRAVLIEHAGGYRFIELDWKHLEGADHVTRKSGKWSITLDFKTPEDMGRWLGAYARVKGLAVQQIFV